MKVYTENEYGEYAQRNQRTMARNPTICDWFESIFQFSSTKYDDGKKKNSILKSMTGHTTEEWEIALGREIDPKTMTIGRFYDLIINELTRLHELEEKGMPFPDQE